MERGRGGRRSGETGRPLYTTVCCSDRAPPTLPAAERMYMRRVRHLVLPTLIGGAVVAGAAASASRALAANMSEVLGASNINPSYYLTSQDSVNEATNQMVGFGSTTVKLEMGL